MPAGLHRFDDATDDDVAALVAERSIEDPEVLLAVLATLELVEDSVLERAEALSAPKTILMRFEFAVETFNLHEALDVPQLPVRVDNLLLRLEALLAASARHRLQTHVGARNYAKIMSKRLIKVLTQIGFVIVSR